MPQSTQSIHNSINHKIQQTPNIGKWWVPLNVELRVSVINLDSLYPPYVLIPDT